MNTRDRLSENVLDALTHTECAHGVLWAPVVVIVDTIVRLVLQTTVISFPHVFITTNLLAFLLALVQEVVVNLRNDSLRSQGIIILRQLVRLIITLGQVHRASSVGISIGDILRVEEICKGLPETRTGVT